MKILPIAVLSAALFACGSNPPPAPADPSQPPATEDREGGHGHGHHEGGGRHKHEGKGEHEHMKPELHEFHESLAPVWHAESDRATKACDASKTLEEKAAGTSDADLVTATKALTEACAKDGRPDVEAKLKAVHERFHALLEKH